jgi:prepilin-type processing-associated H-X9-DG protein
MSQFPPPPPPQGFDPANPDFSAPPKTSGMAVTALVLGIAGILCMPLGIVGLILGIIAITQINKDPRLLAGKGLAIAGIVTGALSTVLLVPALLIAILLPSLGKARELSNRSVCAANLRGIAQATIIYASDNMDSFPNLGPNRIAAQPPVGDIPGGLMHDMFYLVGRGSVAPKQFICKSDPAPTVPSAVGGTYWSSDLSYSYSFAYQYSKSDAIGASWRNTMDAGLPIAADMNPGNQNTKPIKNSLNHQRDGQNVAFADGHAEFVRTPCCGEMGDHIYNVGIANNPSAPGIIGQPPFASPAGNIVGTFDTCLVPGLADSTTYTRQ